jgi:hypothetical protein
MYTVLCLSLALQLLIQHINNKELNGIIMSRKIILVLVDYRHKLLESVLQMGNIRSLRCYFFISFIYFYKVFLIKRLHETTCVRVPFYHDMTSSGDSTLLPVEDIKLI